MSQAPADARAPRRWRWLPPPGSWGQHALLAGAGMLVLGPLAGIAGAYMLFSLGFMVGGQVLAGLLGSAVTVGYGAPGRHGANLIQTTAASVAGMCAAAVLVQAMAWLGLPPPAGWKLALYLLCIGMYGVGVGMLYTPLLVDRMRLTFPSGLAVANLLRALTDPALLRQSLARLGAGGLLGVGTGIAAARSAWIGAVELSASTVGAGMVVGARIGLAALTGGLVGWALSPWFVAQGWLAPGEPFRKFTFLVALGMILGAAIVDMALLFAGLARRPAGARPAAAPAPGTRRWKRDLPRLVAWVVFWGLATLATGTLLLQQPAAWLLLALLLVLVFALVNGISTGVVDQNPISSAFVASVLLMAALGLRDAGIGLMAASVLLVATGEACDMQQDRSTGWRLGTDRRLQFRYQVAGIVVGAVLAVGLAQLFMQSYPVLQLDQTRLDAAQQPAQWGSAMTYKIVGALRGLVTDSPWQRNAMWVGLAIGLATEAARKLLKSRRAYQHWTRTSRAGRATDFAVDAVLLPSPYASSFGGFVNLPTSAWLAAGGVLGSVLGRRDTAPAAPQADDMRTASLVGGGLIAGDALAALGLGVAGLLALA